MHGRIRNQACLCWFTAMVYTSMVIRISPPSESLECCRMETWFRVSLCISSRDDGYFHVILQMLSAFQDWKALYFDLPPVYWEYSVEKQRWNTLLGIMSLVFDYILVTTLPMVAVMDYYFQYCRQTSLPNKLLKISPRVYNYSADKGNFVSMNQFESEEKEDSAFTE